MTQSFYIDLHVHSACSDGTYTPTQLVDYAIKKGLRAIALTDHDTTDGISEAIDAARHTSLTIIPGIELSAAYQGKDIHILGFNIDPDNLYFQESLKTFQKARDQRNRTVIRRMQEQGLQITWEDMIENFPDSVWTRAHFARFLMETGQVHTLAEAFNRFLGDHAPCFVPRKMISPLEAIQLIHEGGGKAVLAHPLLYHFSNDQLEELTALLTTAGLDGIEAIYSTNRGMDEINLRLLAKKHGLFITGGSDFHGSNKPSIDLGCGKGNLKIPASLLEHL